MIILPISDLHLEMWGSHWRVPIDAIPDGADVLALAGDILCFSKASKTEALNMFRALGSKAKHTIFVPGNHEYYGSEAYNLDEWIMNDVSKWVTVMGPSKDRIVKIGKHRFVGCTLWFPDNPSNVNREQFMSDFSVIKGFKPWVYEKHEQSAKFLENNVREGDVVMTHHLPSEKSVHARFAGDPLNCFFVAPMDSVMLENKPALWIHGHTHMPADYKVEQTRVVCNPLGYPREIDARLSDFNPEMQVVI